MTFKLCVGEWRPAVQELPERTGSKQSQNFPSLCNRKNEANTDEASGTGTQGWKLRGGWGFGGAQQGPSQVKTALALVRFSNFSPSVRSDPQHQAVDSAHGSNLQDPGQLSHAFVPQLSHQ